MGKQPNINGSHYVWAVVAIAGMVTLLAAVAMLKGHDGRLLAAALSILSGMAGWLLPSPVGRERK